MADPPRYPSTEDDRTFAPHRGAAARPSRWKLIAGIVAAIVLIGAFIALHVAGVLGPESHK